MDEMKYASFCHQGPETGRVHVFVVSWFVKVVCIGCPVGVKVSCGDVLVVSCSMWTLSLSRFVLMGWCWALTPADRPKFSHLTIRLKEFHEKISAFI